MSEVPAISSVKERETGSGWKFRQRLAQHFRGGDEKPTLYATGTSSFAGRVCEACAHRGSGGLKGGAGMSEHCPNAARNMWLEKELTDADILFGKEEVPDEELEACWTY